MPGAESASGCTELRDLVEDAERGVRRIGRRVVDDASLERAEDGALEDLLKEGDHRRVTALGPRPRRPERDQCP